MMTEKKNSGAITEECYLIKDKDIFQKELEERIGKGYELLKADGYIYASDYDGKEQDVDRLASEYTKWNAYNLAILKRAFNTPFNEYRDSYSRAGVSSVFIEAVGSSQHKNQLKSKITNLESLIETLDLLLISASKENSIASPESIEPNNKVFIVHGHDSKIKIEVARFLESVGLIPIILHEQASGGSTIIEKIEKHADVGFGIVLYTPCDLGIAKKKYDEDKKACPNEHPCLNPRARQNVVFEHGYLIGSIGRSRVCAVTDVGVETPGDITGVVYTPIDAGGAWKYSIAKEMRAAGYNIDMNKIK